MAKAKFDLGDTLAAALGKVSDSDQGEQITYLDIAALDADAGNFYSMEGIDELAANIETIGLQQPLRVRENPDMPGRWLIVSGHRRRAALWSLFEEAPGKWERVPCIIERGAGSPELQELRLIMANSDTRRMSSADTARQAERVQELLYKLKEQGYDFPGRMRDHVAEACKISSTRLATLKVIKDGLADAWRPLYEKNQIREATAYKLAQMTPERQAEIFAATPRQREGRTLYESTVDSRNRDLEKINAIRCTKVRPTQPCAHADVMKQRLVNLDAWTATSCRQCCERCEKLTSCKSSCPKCDEKKKQLNAEKRAANKKAADERAAIEKPKVDYLRLLWQRWNAAREKAGLSVAEARKKCDTYLPMSEAEKIINGAAKVKGDQYTPYHYHTQDTLRRLSESADALGVSLDYLFGRTEDLTPAAPAAAASKQWHSGKDKPTEDGIYACKFKWSRNWGFYRWVSESQAWKFASTGGVVQHCDCVVWGKLPENE